MTHEFKPGDRVQPTGSGSACEIVALHKGRAWLEWSDGSMSSYFLHHLTPLPKPVRWINVYDNGSVGPSWYTRQMADEDMRGDVRTRTAVVITYSDGSVKVEEP